jgi:hypothetical protein
MREDSGRPARRGNRQHRLSLIWQPPAIPLGADAIPEKIADESGHEIAAEMPAQSMGYCGK